MGFESIYTGDRDTTKYQSDEHLKYNKDKDENVYMTYSSWGFAHVNKKSWNNEIRYINSMQKKLGKLDDNTRKIRQYISSLQCCDNGVPTTIDEALNMIGTGKVPEPHFHPGCWMSTGKRTTQPTQNESMYKIENILKGYLNGKTEREFIKKYPNAKGFIQRTYKWFGPLSKFTDLQKSMLGRMMLPFKYFAHPNEDIGSVNRSCFHEGGKGYKLDEKITKLSGLPRIYPNYMQEYRDNLQTIKNAKKKGVRTRDWMDSALKKKKVKENKR